MKAGYRIGYRRVGMEYPMHSDCYQFFVHPFSSFFQQSHTLNKMQYLADTDVFIVTCFHKMMSQVPKSQCGQSLTVTNNMWSHFRCLFTYAHWGLFTSISLNGCLLKWQCPDSKPVSILSWFLLRLSNSPALFAEGFLRQPLSCLCSQTDCQRSSCFLLVHSLISPVATFADIRSTGPGPMSGCEQPCLIHQLLHFHQFHVSPHPYHLNPVMFCQFHQRMMSVPD